MSPLASGPNQRLSVLHLADDPKPSAFQEVAAEPGCRPAPEPLFLLFAVYHFADWLPQTLPHLKIFPETGSHIPGCYYYSVLGTGLRALCVLGTCTTT